MLDRLYHTLDPTAFTIGGMEIRWYGLAWIAGFLGAALLFARIARRWKIRIEADSILTFLIACMLGAVIGGRLGYVLFYGQGYYFAHPLEILATRAGGMSFHGGLLGLAIGIIIAARITRIPILTLGDLAAITAPVGLGLVRIANFVNGELWGAPTTLPWGVVFDNTGGGMLPRHPTQLYEALLEGLVLLLILYFLSRARPPYPRGTYFGVFLIGYGVFRIAIEFVRLPDAQIGYLFGTGWLTMGMLLSLPMILLGGFLLGYARQTRHPQTGQVQTTAEQKAQGEQKNGGKGVE
ncbi:MAG: prolipoprotein diacylglyceryl transferase [Coriobacteriales bacterium]|nr:prolipoprotein diacylglyceryl transferase [Coriobacteriales bacterium]